MRGKCSIHEGVGKRSENLTAKSEPKRSPRIPVGTWKNNIKMYNKIYIVGEYIATLNWLWMDSSGRI
jgi:hypothetical protein